MRGDRGVERRLGMEVVGRLADGQAGQDRQPGTGPEGVLRMGVDPRSDRGPAERHRQELCLRGARATDPFLDLAGVAAELLAEPDRRRVLQVGPARLDDRPELLLLGHERGVEALEGRQQLVLDGDRGRQLEGRRDRVVRALAAIDIVIGMDGAASQARAREVGHDLVHVRVGRGRGAGLVDIDRELVGIASGCDLGRGRGDGGRDIRFEQPELSVGVRGGLFDQRQGTQETGRQAGSRDREVEDRTLGRGAVQGVRRDLHLAHRIALRAGRAPFGLGHGPIVRARPRLRP